MSGVNAVGARQSRCQICRHRGRQGHRGMLGGGDTGGSTGGIWHDSMAETEAPLLQGLAFVTESCDSRRANSGTVRWPTEHGSPTGW